MRKFQTVIFYEDKDNLDHYLQGFHFEEPITCGMLAVSRFDLPIQIF
jgi:hypothetical protein